MIQNRRQTDTADDCARRWEFWEGKARDFIKGIIIPSISLAWLKVNSVSKGWSLSQVIDLPNWNVRSLPRPEISFSSLEGNSCLLMDLCFCGVISTLWVPGIKLRILDLVVSHFLVILEGRNALTCKGHLSKSRDLPWL